MIKPQGHRVLIKLDPIEKTYGEMGIIKAIDEKLERTGTQRGILVANGPQAWLAFREVDDKGNEHNGKPWAKPGDYVLFARFAGRTVEDPFEDEGNKDYHIMNDEDILAVIEEGTYDIKPNPHRQKIIRTGDSE